MAAQGVFIKGLTNKILLLVSQELMKPESQGMIKQNVIIPVINSLYSELYPYIITFVITMTLILVFSLATFIGFILYYFKK